MESYGYENQHSDSSNMTGRTESKDRPGKIGEKSPTPIVEGTKKDDTGSKSNQNKIGGEGSDSPDRTTRIKEEVRRDNSIVEKLKEKYSYQCQVCRDQRFQGDSKRYAEGHHIKPLRPDGGPDIVDNILVLCPNHHIDFEYGMIRVDPDNFKINHRYESDLNGETLRVLDSHNISRYIQYHDENIAEF